MSTGACVGMASQAEEKCDTSLTVWLPPPRCITTETSDSVGSEKDEWVVLFHKNHWCSLLS